MADKNTLSIILRELGRCMAPLVGDSGNPNQLPSFFTVLLEEMGVTIEKSLGVEQITKVREILLKISNILDEILPIIERSDYPNLNEIPQLVNAINKTIGALTELSSLKFKVENEDLLVEIGDMGLRILEYLFSSYLEAEHSSIFYLLELLGIVDTGDIEAERLIERLPRLDLPLLVSFLQDPQKILAKRYNWDREDGKEFNIYRALAPLLLLLQTWDLPAIFVYPAAEDGKALSWDGTVKRPDLQLQVPLIQEEFGATVDVGFAILPQRAPAGSINGMAILPYGMGSASKKLDLGSKWELDYRFSGNVTGRFGIIVNPTGVNLLSLDPNVSSPVDIFLRMSAGLVRKTPPLERIFLIGASDTAFIDIGSFDTTVGFELQNQTADFFIEISIKDGRLVVKKPTSDGFLQKVLPDSGITSQFAVTVGFSEQRGIYFCGGAGLEATLPINKSILDIITIESVYLALCANAETGKANAEKKPASIESIVAISGKIKLGPFNASAQRLGMRAILSFPPNGNGNLGVANLDLGFKSPDGASVSLDNDMVKGGGYLAFDDTKKQYSGIVHLELKSGIAITAIGLITTILPGNKPGFSLLIIISAELPPIQLGYGFTLNGIGGLLGVNRAMNLEALREGVRSGMIASVMFPHDPVNNAPKIISDIQTIFPPVDQRFVLGPMLKIGWGTPTLITASLGIVIELPSPVKVAIMGRVHMALPDQKTALIELNLDVLGTLEFEKSLLTIDAALYDSRIAMFAVTGAMALRLRWGTDPLFVLSVGGFNPRFQPPPEFPDLPRMALSLTNDKPPDDNKPSNDQKKEEPYFGLRFECYFAMTINTLQMGARLDAWATAKLEWPIGEIEARAQLAFDALMQFSPFGLIADLEGRLAIKIKAAQVELAGGLKLLLTGPEPWHAVGYAYADLGRDWKPRIPLEITIGQQQEEKPPLPVDVKKLLLEALSQPGNWSAELPDSGSMVVALRKPDPEVEIPKGGEPTDNKKNAQRLRVHPFGQLSVQQRVVPLNTRIDCYGYAPIEGDQIFSISGVLFNNLNPDVFNDNDNPVRDTFARGQFFKQTDDEKLSQPQFEELPCGRRGISLDKSAIKLGLLVTDEAEAYETAVFDADEREVQHNYSIPLDALQVAIGLGAAAQSLMRQSASDKFAGPLSRAVKVNTPSYAVWGTDTVLSDNEKPTPYPSYTAARAALKSSGNGKSQQIIEINK